VIGTAVTNLMKTSSLIVALGFFTLSAMTNAQAPLLYYKFDRGFGSDTINYGTARVTSSVATAAKPSSPWVSPGRYGPAMLQGSRNTASSETSNCLTGFTTGFTGDFTVHWWMQQRHPVGSDRSYVFGGPGAFRCFTNGIAGTSLWLRGFSQTTVNILMPESGRSIQARAAGLSGVCVGVVVKQTAPGESTAQWYVDGAPHGSAQSLLASGDVVPDVTPLRIGQHIDAQFSSVWDIDEFRLCNFAATPSQIADWCSAPSAAVGPLGTECGVELAATGGVPAIGNAGFTCAFQATPSASTMFLLVVGVRRTLPFDMGAVFPGLAGCLWYASFDNQLSFRSDASGAATLASAVPANPSFAGLHIDLQALGAQGSTLLQSNMLSLVVEAN
jgi:hypothetical protein